MSTNKTNDNTNNEQIVGADITNAQSGNTADNGLTIEYTNEQQDNQQLVENAQLTDANTDVDLPNNNDNQQSEKSSKSGGKAKKRSELIINIALGVAILVFVVTIIVRLFFFCHISISQRSMEPTYHDGDKVWVRRANSAQRGQVVVFFQNDTHEGFWSTFTEDDVLIIKRVVAVSGDSIWVEKEANGEYSLRVKPKDSDQVLTEDYYYKDNVKVQIPNMDAATLGILQDHIGEHNALVIEENCFFAMGDNRPISDDSRHSYGQISFDRMLGIVM